MAMQRLLSIVLLVALSTGVFANPVRLARSQTPWQVKESISSPCGWVKHSSPPPGHPINLRIGLSQPNFAVLEQHLYEISDPFHDRYGQYLSKEEVESLVSPHQDSIDFVNQWLASHGIKEGDIERSPTSDWVKVSVPVELAEDILDTTYHVWEHLETGERVVRATTYSLPADLHAHIDFVQPTTLFGSLKTMKSTIVSIDEAPERTVPSPPIDIGNGIMVDPSCNTTITVDCLNQLYNATEYKAQGKGSIGITGYLEQFANIQDLDAFFEEQRPDAVGSRFRFISVNGGINNQTLEAAGEEANLDVQFAFGISHPIPATFYSTAGRAPLIHDALTPNDTNEPYDKWLDFVLAHPNPPRVISTSYGDNEQTVPELYARWVCRRLAQLGARGVSLLFSSGDGGVGDNNPDPATQKCFTNDGCNTTTFLPSFPASCPYVTTVGGTANIPEVAVSRFFSGGGFSNYFLRPKYQEKAVLTYLHSLPKGVYRGLFNPQGRAYPDVAAQSDRFSIHIRGKRGLIGGTSASCPAFAGYVALLNDARMRKKLPPLGFLNPLLYSHATSGLNDITSGHNPGCGTEGFNATEGWDPVTGLGTPNFGKLLELLTRH